MDVLMIMGLGVLAGRFLIPNRTKKGNDLPYMHFSFNFFYGRDIRQK